MIDNDFRAGAVTMPDPGASIQLNMVITLLLSGSKFPPLEANDG